MASGPRPGGVKHSLLKGSSHSPPVRDQGSRSGPVDCPGAGLRWVYTNSCLRNAVSVNGGLISISVAMEGVHLYSVRCRYLKPVSRTEANPVASVAPYAEGYSSEERQGEIRNA
ncbi:hypothetical protein N7468_004599 [Penicillium chermesinum]|uniref:Uncharacterized protein n=1 Tax=Penicillium chermesinum TaxID=63820 RepID=A0A9W9TSP8_9EURO|nr:uncharacterized protein N7468_004599 [Penicillium chermesinum]KAJ5239980.1 hypothetical protein N7468_004599 [Penicillium chermesinum]